MFERAEKYFLPHQIIQIWVLVKILDYLRKNILSNFSDFFSDHCIAIQWFRQKLPKLCNNRLLHDRGIGLIPSFMTLLTVSKLPHVDILEVSKRCEMYFWMLRQP